MTRFPADITHNGKRLSDILDAHAKWLRGESGARADLTRADLAGARGNMREVKSAQLDTWPLTWTTAPDGVVTLQIGCQRHTVQSWEEFDDDDIDAMDDDALAWWRANKDFVLDMVRRFPATPYGKAKS